jgi:hypothetical protein
MVKKGATPPYSPVGIKESFLAVNLRKSWAASLWFSRNVEHFCPKCATLRAEWFRAINRFRGVKPSSRDEYEAAIRGEYRSFTKYVERHRACRQCSRATRPFPLPTGGGVIKGLEIWKIRMLSLSAGNVKKLWFGPQPSDAAESSGHTFKWRFQTIREEIT